MPAPSIDALFDFETQIEQAAHQILTDSGIAAFITAQAEALPLIHTGVSFDLGPAAADMTFLPLGLGEPPPPRQEYYRYSGDLGFEVSVERDTVRQPTADGVRSFLGQCRGRIRSTFMFALRPFDDADLPFLRVTDIRPNGTTSGFNQVRNVDTVILRFALTFAIQPSAWPVDFPPA